MNSMLLIPVLAGWVLGLLANYLADVLPTTRRFVHPACPHCGTKYPINDYLLIRACRQCKKGRGTRTWIILGVMLAASLFIWIDPLAKLGYAIGIVLFTYFTVIFVIDMEHRLILHPTSVFGFFLGLGAGWLTHDLVPTLLGGLGGFIIMLVFYYLGVLFSRFRARRMQAAGQTPDDEEALGAGDVILAGILGLTLGWPLIWFGLLLGILLGGVFGVFLVASWLIRRRYKNQALMVFMPYGPFFILSAVFIVYLPNWLVTVVPK